jgi:hypothetical protein
MPRDISLLLFFSFLLINLCRDISFFKILELKCYEIRVGRRRKKAVENPAQKTFGEFSLVQVFKQHFFSLCQAILPSLNPQLI